MEKECSNCKHDGLSEYEFPCSKCRNIYSPTTQTALYNSTPLMWEAANDSNVEHPAHYNHGKYECIEVMVENFGKEAVEHFCLLNAFKYIWRTNYKNGVEDVKKAMSYLDYYLKLEGEESVENN